MKKEQIIKKMICQLAKISLQNVMTGNLAQDDFAEIIRIMNLLEKLPIYIDDTGGLNVEQIVSRSKMLHGSKKIQYINIEYLGLVALESDNNLANELGKVTKKLKTLAKD